MRLFQRLILMIVGTLPELAAAQTADTTLLSGAQVLQFDSVWPMVVRLVLTLGVIVVVIVGAIWMLKWVMARRWAGKVQNHPIRVLDRIQLAPKQSLNVVAVGERVILLGVTETGISFLTELSPAEKGQLLHSATGETGFKSTLGEAKARMHQVFSQVRTALPGRTASAGATAETL